MKENANKGVTDNNEAKVNYDKTLDVTLNGNKHTLSYVKGSTKSNEKYNMHEIKLYFDDKAIDNKFVINDDEEVRVIYVFKGLDENDSSSEYAVISFKESGTTHNYIIDAKGNVLYDAEGALNNGIILNGTEHWSTNVTIGKMDYTTWYTANGNTRTIDTVERYERNLSGKEDAVKHRIYVVNGIAYDTIEEVYAESDYTPMGR